jgi:hypothetical protein
VVDIAGCSSRSNTVQELLYRQKYEVIRAELAAAGLWGCWTEDDRGDGLLLVFDPAVHKVDITEALTVRLYAGLRRFAQLHSTEAQMRMRVALHAGDLTHTGEAWAGRDLVTTFRLADSTPVRDHLADNPLAVIVSDHWYQAVVRDERGLIEAGGYRQVRVTHKEVDEIAWVYTPGGNTSPNETPADHPTPPPATNGGITFFGDVTHYGDNINGPKIVYRDGQ